MKNIFTLLVGGLLTTSAFANSVTVTFSGNNSYQVLIDGRNVSNYNYSGSTIYLNDLQFGQHSIQVLRTKRGGWFGSRNNAVYSSSFNYSPQYDLQIAIDNNGYAQMYQTKVGNYGRDNGRWKGNDQYGKDNHGRNHRDNDGDDDDDRGYNRNGNYDNGNYDNRNGGYNGGYNNGYRQAMNDYDFNQLVQKIRNQWIGKMNTGRDAVSNNNLSTYQARQILQIFSSESDRLELAKLSYRNIVDQQNFRQLFDLFSYQSQNELDRYVRDFRY